MKKPKITVYHNIIQEKEAKQKICPFIKENCKGSMCLSWKKVGNIDFLEVLKLKVDLRLTDDEKNRFKLLEDVIERDLDKANQTYPTKTTYEDVYRWLESKNTRFDTIMTKLAPELSDVESESQEGYCIMLKE